MSQNGTRVNNVDPDQTPQNEASDRSSQYLHGKQVLLFEMVIIISNLASLLLNMNLPKEIV